MNPFELLESRVSVIQMRLQKLEVAFAAAVAGDGDGQAALAAARTLGFGVEVLALPARTRMAERRRLAAELRRALWSPERVARVLKCSEKTVRRWEKCPDTKRIADCRLPIADLTGPHEQNSSFCGPAQSPAQTARR